MYFLMKMRIFRCYVSLPEVNQIVLPFLRFKKMARGHVEICNMDLIYHSRSNISVRKKRQTSVFIASFCHSVFPSLVDNFVAGNKLS